MNLNQVVKYPYQDNKYQDYNIPTEWGILLNKHYWLHKLKITFGTLNWLYPK